MAKIIILLRNIIKFIISQFKVLTIFYLMYEYFRSFLRISHEFCIFDLDQSILFFILGISCKTCDYSAPTVKYGTHLLRFSIISIFLTIDFKAGTWRKEAHLVCKKESFIQKNYPERRIIQKYSSKNLHQQLDLCSCFVLLR